MPKIFLSAGEASGDHYGALLMAEVRRLEPQADFFGLGGNSLKMEWLRKACTDAGLENVRTYVQSGNIVFSSRLGAAKLAPMLKTMIDAAKIQAE